MEKELELCSSGSLRHRQVSHMLFSEKHRLEEQKEAKQERHQRMKKILKSKGVSTQNVELLPEDEDAPLPEPILAQCLQHKKQEEENAKEKREETAKKVFENPWLLETEKKLCDLVSQKQTERNPSTLSGITGMIQVLTDKLKTFHSTMGTWQMKEALKERKRICITHGFLDASKQELVTSLSQTLPSKDISTHAVIESSQCDSDVFEGFFALNSQPRKRPNDQSVPQQIAKRKNVETPKSTLSEILMSKGVTKEHVQLFKDNRQPLPREIIQDLSDTHEKLLKAKGYQRSNFFAKYLPVVIPDSDDEDKSIFITPDETPRPESQSPSLSSQAKKKKTSAAKQHTASSSSQSTIKNYFV